MVRTGREPMTEPAALDRIAINVKAYRLLEELLRENPRLEEIMRSSKNEVEALVGVRKWVLADLESRPAAMKFYESAHPSRKDFEALGWSDIAAIRILDYIDNAGREFEDLNLRSERALSNPITGIWLAVNHGTGGARPDFFEDMLHLFRQFSGRSTRRMPSKEVVVKWMERHPSGLDPRIVRLREENRERILKVLIGKLDAGEIRSTRYSFEAGLSGEEKFARALEWWDEPQFHLGFAVRSPELLNEFLGHSLDPNTMRLLGEARDKGIPFFVNLYYLSLLHVRVPYFAIGADMAIRDYVLYTRQLVDSFGSIVAWEKEDEVEPGRPNAAGWLLPSDRNVHRRYPDVAILIPDTVGRACGGLCASCQRMYDFQSGRLNFDLEKLQPAETWEEKLRRLMKYFENDSQLRDILITGGDALMSTDAQLSQILEAVYEMAVRKRAANKKRTKRRKYAEIVRVRLGTRLPAYLPQRVTPELERILGDFRAKARAVGIRQFVVQTHFESPMEVTPEARQAVSRLLSAGWTVVNQLVLTTAASRRGHSAKLREVLGRVGVLPYYTFSVKGYQENWHNFATNARNVQEQMEERVHGVIPEEHAHELVALTQEPGKTMERIEELREKAELPFLATDRSVLNLPGVGKSLTFRVIGITRYGRRILEFDHDPTRNHSPVIEKMGKVIVIEPKAVAAYLRQLDELGEDVSEYADVWGYSLGVTEPRAPLYEYPESDLAVTPELTNFELVVPGD
jgi:lysine 2,3-aminomutase